MQDFNKLISLFIGLFVVIFVIAFAFGRIKIGSKKATPKIGGSLGTIFNIPQPKATPTPTVKPQKITIKTVVEAPKTTSTTQTTMARTTLYANANQPVSTIPKTGPEFLLPSIGMLFAAGMYLRKKS